MIFLTGDTHGTIDIRKLCASNFDRKGLTKNDYVIILGDFGLIWSYPPSKEDKWWLNYLQEAPWTTLVVLGNHENYPLIRTAFGMEKWKGGRVRPFCPNVLQLVDNEVFDIDGHTFFVRGGANSIDRHMRVAGESWWKEEVPSEKEREAAIAKLDSIDWKVDYVLTHEAPVCVHEWLYKNQTFTDEYAKWLQTIANKLSFKRWFFGHHHQNVTMHLSPQGFKPKDYEEWVAMAKCYRGLYNSIVTLDGELSDRVTAPESTTHPFYGG